MKEYRPIQVNDKVVIYFHDDSCMEGVVKYIPCATGDSWGIWTENNQVSYVQQFEVMNLIAERTGQ